MKAPSKGARRDHSEADGLVGRVQGPHLAQTLKEGKWV